MNFLGINLSEADPRLVEVQADHPDAAGSPMGVRPIPVAGAGAAGSPLWGQLRDLLALRPGTELEQPAAFAKGRLDPIQALGVPFREAIDARDPSTPLVFVYPYRTPPILRRHLPALVGRQPLAIKGGANPGRRLIGVEAPVALAVEAVARHDGPWPVELLLVTGSGPGRELSASTASVAIDADSERPHLLVDVRACHPIGSPGGLARAVDRLRGLALPPGLRLVVEGGGAADVVEALGPLAGPVTRLDGEAPAMQGAVRFAGVHPEFGLPLLGPRSLPVEVQGVYPSATGVVGTNGRGEWFWCRLAPPESRMPTPEAVVHAEEKGPYYKDYILIAELEGHAHDEARWLHQDTWAAAGLIAHEHPRAISARRALKPGLHAWSFQLKPRDPMDPWGNLPWSLQYHPPADG